MGLLSFSGTWGAIYGEVPPIPFLLKNAIDRSVDARWCIICESNAKKIVDFFSGIFSSTSHGGAFELLLLIQPNW